MIKKSMISATGLLISILAFGVCDPVGDEPEPISLEVLTSGDGVTTSVNDLGWEVTVTTFRVAIRDIELTIEGETHASLMDLLRELAVPAALAHPGHYAGGEVTGELAGDFVIDLVDGAGQALGEATLLPGDYNGMNLYFRAAKELADGDPLKGHAAVIEGTAADGADTIAFTAVIDIEDGTQMVGGPFELDADEDTAATLFLTAYTIDPSENDALFDGLDFGALDGDDDGAVAIVPGSAEHNILMKTLIRHDHWGMLAE